jgi:hypothetical protein
MKRSRDDRRKVRVAAILVMSLLWMVVAGLIARPAQGQVSDWSSNPLALPRPTVDHAQIFGPNPAGPSPQGNSGVTSLGSYNSQSRSLSAAQPPLTVTGPPQPSQGPLVFHLSSLGTGDNGSAIGSFPRIEQPQPNGSGSSRIIAPNGSVIPLTPPAQCNGGWCNELIAQGTWPTPGAGDVSAPVSSPGEWRSYVCQGEKDVSDGKQIVDTLKDAGVASEAIETLTEALKEHSALVVVAVVGGYMFYQINCQ